MSRRSLTASAPFAASVLLVCVSGCGDDDAPRGCPIDGEGVEPIADCREHVAASLCELTYFGDDGDPDTPLSECNPGVSEAITARFVALVDKLPQPFQTLYCSLDRIEIAATPDPTWNATGGNGTTDDFDWDDDGRIQGASLTFRKEALDELENMAHFRTWGDQLFFGGDPAQRYATDESLVSAEFELRPAVADDFLLFVVLHELAHVLDQLYALNCPDWQEDCGFESTWTAINFNRREVVIPGQPEDQPKRFVFTRKEHNNLPYSDDLCAYCDRDVDPSHMEEVYEHLVEQSGFATLYGSMTPAEDLAEFLTLRAIRERYHLTYTMHVPGSRSFDLAHKLATSPMFDAQRAYLDELYADPSFCSLQPR